MDGWTELLRLQDGVIGRDQLLTAGLAPHDIRRLVRRRELTLVRRGIYLDHTGAPTRRQREWMAVRAHWPAALSHASALDFDATATGPVHIAVDSTRRVNRCAGVTAHYVSDLEARVQWNLAPPRIRLEEAVLDLAAAATHDHDVIAVLADAVSSRRTTPDRLLAALEARSRVAGRAFIVGVLADVAAGTCSVLEHRFLSLVERRHGLPTAKRQVRDSTRGTVYRDVVLTDFGVVVELDGRLIHNRRRQREADLERDLWAAAGGLLTIRLGWRQVVEQPCRTARALAEVLTSRGWSGRIGRCPDCA